MSEDKYTGGGTPINEITLSEEEKQTKFLKARIVELGEEVKSFNHILAGGSELDQEYLRKHKAVQAYKQALSTPPEELARGYYGETWGRISQSEKDKIMGYFSGCLKILNRKAKGE